MGQQKELVEATKCGSCCDLFFQNRYGSSTYILHDKFLSQRSADSVYFILVMFSSLFIYIFFLLCGACAKHLTSSILWGFKLWRNVRQIIDRANIPQQQEHKAQNYEPPSQLCSFTFPYFSLVFFCFFENPAVFSEELGSASPWSF